jgi:hypothetical protein
MNDFIQEIIDVKKDLANLNEQIEGASYMVNDNSPHYDFLKYLQRVLMGMHDKLGFQLKVSREKSPPLNCS